MHRFLCLLILWPVVALSAEKQTREEKVRGDRERIAGKGLWIYNDLDEGFARARLTGRPLLVAFRCIPCEECVKLDDDLIEQDPVLRPLLEKFVCVRKVSTNGLDLTQFQFDTDQSFHMFMMNGDGAIYGRYGTRSHRTDWKDDVSVAGLARALEGALELHAGYPANAASLAGKRGAGMEFSRPEAAPSLAGKYNSFLNYEGNLVQSCIHCHQIGDAQRQYYRSRKEPIPDRVLFPFPHPKAIGLIFDPQERATVIEVREGTPASRAGFQAGDRIVTLNDQPLLSMADVQWVLQQVDAAGGQVASVVDRNGTKIPVTLTLAPDWRQADDISWRVSSWGLVRMATGGLRLESLTPQERGQVKVPAGDMVLRVKSVGKYGPHAAAKNAGFEVGDLIIRYDGRNDLLREADVLRQGVTQRKLGEKVTVTVLRNGQQLELALPMQE